MDVACRKNLSRGANFACINPLKPLRSKQRVVRRRSGVLSLKLLVGRSPLQLAFVSEEGRRSRGPPLKLASDCEGWPPLAFDFEVDMARICRRCEMRLGGLAAAEAVNA